jgi:multicomponent Na+:H+ antiporter subunit E
VRRLAVAALFVTLWILAWGQITIANFLSGVLVTAVLLLAFPLRRGGRDRWRGSFVGTLRLAAYVSAQLVRSNLVMSAQILRGAAGRPGVLAHRLRRRSEEVATLMSSVIALSPGTMTVDVARDSSVVYVHFFDLRDVDAARALLRRLEQHVIDAIAARPEHHHPAEQSPDKETP